MENISFRCLQFVFFLFFLFRFHYFVVVSVSGEHLINEYEFLCLWLVQSLATLKTRPYFRFVIENKNNSRTNVVLWKIGALHISVIETSVRLPRIAHTIPTNAFFLPFLVFLFLLSSGTWLRFVFFFRIAPLSVQHKVQRRRWRAVNEKRNVYFSPLNIFRMNVRTVFEKMMITKVNFNSYLFLSMTWNGSE